jgi:uncharacterized protein YjbJ (UPF0337 family)
MVRRISPLNQDVLMNWDEIMGSWREQKGRLKEKWGELTDDDLDRIEGKRDQLLGFLQKRYGKTVEAAEREVREFEDSWRTTGAQRY